MSQKKLKKEINGLLLIIFTLVCSAQLPGQPAEGGNRRIVIKPRAAALQINSTQQFTAKIVERNVETEADFTWSMDATGFGEIDGNGLFTALKKGQGFIYAQAEDLSARARVSVIDTGRGTADRASWSHLEIVPADTLLLLGESVQFAAVLYDTSGTGHDTSAVWTLRGRQTGELTENGLFTASLRGVGVVMARTGRFTATTRIITAAEEDSAKQRNIRIRFRDQQGIMLGDSARVKDSQVYVIRGLSFPYNVLNGGQLIFPPGSLEENIEIRISISETASVDDDSTVTWTDQIINGISFNVYVDGEHISPYYFNEPVQLVLPYKQSLLDSLGIDEDNLWMFFYSEGAYSADGITNVFIDTTVNKIYAEIIHFSDIVITDADRAATPVFDEGNAQPREHTLFSNYPNPFNPGTSIPFMIGGNAKTQVRLQIFNLLGQKVRTLLNESRHPGFHTAFWDGKDETGKDLPSGIYISQLRTSGFRQNKTMLLLK